VRGMSIEWLEAQAGCQLGRSGATAARGV